MKVQVKTRPGVQHFRRCGMLFTQNPEVVEVSKEELELLEAEDRLVVEAVPKPKASRAPAPRPRTEPETAKE